jgi:biotin carboxyl carrier protein
MKLDLTINGADTAIELLERAPECRFRFGGVESTAQVELPEPGVYSILMDGRSYDARVEESPAGLIVVIDGHRFEVQVRDPRRRSRGSAGRHADGVQQVAAPMPGKVIRVLVAPGDTVVAGQGLVVVEAMKMQNELKALRDGRIGTMSAREGSTVIAGEVLATIE